MGSHGEGVMKNEEDPWFSSFFFEIPSNILQMHKGFKIKMGSTFTRMS